MRALFLCCAIVPVLWAQSSNWKNLVAEKRWAEAEPLLLRALNEAPGSAPELEALSQLYRATGRLAEADPLLDRLVAAAENVANMEASGRVKAGLGRYDQAQRLLERALELRLDADATPIAAIPTRRQLAQVLVAQKKYSEAVQQALIAVSVRSRVLGNEHPDLAGDFALLARIHQAESRWQEAAAAWENVVRIQTTALGPEDIRVADSLQNMALCYGEFRQIAQAEQALKRALAIRQVNLGGSHPDVAETTDALGKLMYSAGRYVEAELFFERSLEIFTAYLGQGNPLLTRSYDNLAVTEATLEKWTEARQHYREALRIRDADTALNLRHLGLVETARGDIDAAQTMYRRALDILEVPGNENAELRKNVQDEYDRLPKPPANTPVSKQVPRGKRAPVSAKQK